MRACMSDIMICRFVQVVNRSLGAEVQPISEAARSTLSLQASNQGNLKLNHFGQNTHKVTYQRCLDV